SLDELADIVSWARGRRTPIAVRLVKGAYWDSEIIQARAEGWPVPVFERKDETDANYERLTRLLLDHSADVRPAFASHNLRSLAYAIGYARSRGIHDSAFEIQMLHGMAEPIHVAIRRLGLRLRVYAPVGDLVPGMAYLVRRLLENTSNESFVRHRFEEQHSLDELVRPPEVDVLPAPEEPRPGNDTDPAVPGPYRHEPHAELRRAPARERLARAVRVLADALAEPIDVPAVIGGDRVHTSASIDSVDPGDVDRLVARSASCSTADADAAVEAAAEAFPAWSATPAPDRAAVLFRAAAWMRARRAELAALVLFEAGKPWREADADVCEAIDFCEYYGREMLRLDEGGRVLSPPGEHNRLRYQGRGVVAVIAPWNFPLAIPAGMVAAALVTGNCVVLKPAEQTPAVASRLVEAMEAAGLPAGVLNFLPGAGEVVGAHLVAHPAIAQVAFTGSRAVGLGIVERAGRQVDGQRQVKRVIAEMGGKNALVVDADADLDQAVPATISSAFGYAGQKCSAVSRVVVLDDVYEDFLQRLVGAAAQQRTGHPSDMGVQVGPLIDADAHERVERYVALAASEATVAHRGSAPDEPRGWYASPAIVTGLSPASSVARDEIFGPVLAVFHAPDFETALELANDTDYALTAGVMSRSPAHIAEAAARLRAGNVYVNRGTTGAIVGRQPFGGYGLSGVGSKAGGPDYLQQFLDPRVVTENTLRQGFAPGTEGTDR
ncbi:MAG TPA: bifunctional proline dehydrogenase/L-glutamate gamma-semialdehyde dehydrogenase, partial [Acidimicrobiales bacterium]|nr:bifunctional proline dehydrogenase/L-glutamate gamma-semialdehyde dehydrogenase [Acidimicrobiales bacterium]